jgi:hypothetical protein
MLTISSVCLCLWSHECRDLWHVRRQKKSLYGLRTRKYCYYICNKFFTRLWLPSQNPVSDFLSVGDGPSFHLSLSVTCGSHLRELGMRRETLPKHSRILKSMESEIGRHKLLHNTAIFEQSRSARTMGIHNWENSHSMYPYTLLSTCTTNRHRNFSPRTRSLYPT